MENPNLAPFYSCKDEPTIHQGCVMWGILVVIPSKLCTRILEELHIGHLVVVKMKALARSFVRWPDNDQQIKHLVKEHMGCQQVQVMPKPAPLCL